MFRNANEADLPALCGLMREAFGDGEAFARMVFERFAGPGNVYVAAGEGQTPSAMLSAVPVTMQGQKGVYWYALATAAQAQGQGLMTGLMDYAAAQAQGRGCRFITLIPAGAGLFRFYAQRGFEKAFGLRRVQRPVRRNLWAQADFDAVTAKSLLKLRQHYLPGSVLLGPESMVEVLADLYRCGATIVSTDEGYGLYFKAGATLHFAELAAASDRAAEQLLEAAREKTGADQAVITLGQAQNLFLGEGAPLDYGMVRFLGQPMDMDQSYMRLMMDDEPAQG